MSELYNRIESLCKERGSNITEMCRQSGAPRGSLSDLKAGKTNRLNTTTLGKIATHFGVSVDFLLGNEEQKKSTDQSVSGLKETGYELLTPENRQMIDSLIASLLKSQSGE